MFQTGEGERGVLFQGQKEGIVLQREKIERRRVLVPSLRGQIRTRKGRPFHIWFFVGGGSVRRK